MNTGKTLFAQLMDFLPWTTFTRIVDRYGGDHRVRTLSCAEQYRSMAFAQLTYRESLRDIETCLSVHASKLYHMGFRQPVRRSTLADANERRDWRIHAALAQRLITQARTLYVDEELGLDLTNTVYALDSTTIALCLSVFPWAHFRTTKAAVKMHTLLDLRGNIPSFIHISDGKLHDVHALDMLLPEASGGRGDAVEAAVRRGCPTARGVEAVAASEDDDRGAAQGQRPSAQDHAEVGDPESGAGGSACQASRDQEGTRVRACRASSGQEDVVEVAVRCRRRSPQGSAKVTMLAMHRDGLIALPAPQGRQNRPGPIVFGPDTEAPLFPAPTTLDEVRPLDLRPVVRGTRESKLWNEFVARYHYLGYKTLVGAQMRYAVHDRDGWPLAMLGFSTAAWKLAPRDNFIGWTRQLREKNLPFVVDNPRFLILPWINIPNLGSHILAIIRRRLPDDWTERYNTTPVLIETFVETPRYTGAVYRASGWTRVGTTQGRGRYDRDRQSDKPKKDVWLRPLRRDWKCTLNR